MQTDGNLVQYPVGTSNTAEYSYWSSGTNGQGNNVSLCLDDDCVRITFTKAHMRCEVMSP